MVCFFSFSKDIKKRHNIIYKKEEEKENQFKWNIYKLSGRTGYIWFHRWYSEIFGYQREYNKDMSSINCSIFELLGVFLSLEKTFSSCKYSLSDLFLNFVFPFPCLLSCLLPHWFHSNIAATPSPHPASHEYVLLIHCHVSLVFEKMIHLWTSCDLIHTWEWPRSGFSLFHSLESD